MVGGGCRRDGLSVEHCGMSRGWGERDEAGGKHDNENQNVGDVGSSKDERRQSVGKIDVGGVVGGEELRRR
jgi:hypothetical protein